MSPAPMRCATSVLLALPSASGSMNSSDTRLAAIWWPATGVAPRREMKIAMKAKPVTSTPMPRPIGTPRRSSARIDGPCGLRTSGASRSKRR